MIPIMIIIITAIKMMVINAEQLNKGNKTLQSSQTPITSQGTKV